MADNPEAPEPEAMRRMLDEVTAQLDAVAARLEELDVAAGVDTT